MISVLFDLDFVCLFFLVLGTEPRASTRQALHNLSYAPSSAWSSLEASTECTRIDNPIILHPYIPQVICSQKRSKLEYGKVGQVA
jgi:hypothetical protein